MSTRPRRPPARRQEELYPGPSRPSRLPDSPTPEPREWPERAPFDDDGPPPPDPAAETSQERQARDQWLEQTAARFADEERARAYRAELEGHADIAMADAEQWRGWRTVALRTICRAGKLPVDYLLRLT